MNTINTWIDRATALIERLDKWWNKEAKPQLVRIEKTPEYLAGRIIYCAQCERNQTLWRYRGRLVCAVCCSDSWTYPISLMSFLYKQHGA